MTRQHFEMIAGVVRRMLVTDNDRASIGKAFADQLALTNGRFDRDRFLAACDIPSEAR